MVVLGITLWSVLTTTPPAVANGPKRVELSDENWLVQGGDGEERKDAAALRKAVVAWQEAWIGRDMAASGNLLADDILLASQSQAGIFSGREAALAALPKEWVEYESDDRGGSALTGTLLQVRAEIRGDAALLNYYMRVSGGNIWEFDDMAAFVQIFTRESAAAPWRLAFGAGAWGLGYDPESGEAEPPTFAYDYALPVRDLARAVAFYRPLLGEPEALTEETAVFEVKGSWLYLAAGEEIEELAPLRPGLPNGWVIITPPDFDAAQDDGEENEVGFPDDEQTFADLRVLYGYEPSGNLVALARPVQGKAGAAAPKLVGEGSVQGAPLAPAVATADAALRTAWLNRDLDGYLQQCLPEAVLLDAARSLTRGWSLGEKALRRTLVGDFGKGNKEASHPFATLELKKGESRRFGPWQVIARSRIATGAEPWKRRQESLEASIHAIDSGRLAASLTLAAGRPKGLALQFDYSGMPALEGRWKATDRALKALTGGAESYKDEGWKGYWGERAVMGMFLADPEEDRMPRRQEASTYLSVHVAKAEQALAHAKQAGSKFPAIPAINGGEPGLNRLPGYNQVYVTDSEGNGIVLTGYTGRGKGRGAKKRH